MFSLTEHEKKFYNLSGLEIMCSHWSHLCIILEFTLFLYTVFSVKLQYLEYWWLVYRAAGLVAQPDTFLSSDQNLAGLVPAGSDNHHENTPI